jgi:glycosyltransferase involved in cell wall biosynthesis
MNPASDKKALFWLSPGSPQQRTGGFLYNARMVQELSALGQGCVVVVLDGEWPFPGAVAGHRSVLGQIPDGATVIADGLCWTGLNADARRQLCGRCRVWVVVHSPLDKEGAEGASELADLEVKAIQTAHGVWATSIPTASLMGARLGRLGLAVIVPGTDAVPMAGQQDACSLLTVGHLTARKNQILLIEALAQCKDLEWTLKVVGSDMRAPDVALEIKQSVAAFGLDGRVDFLGELNGPEMGEAYRSAGLLIHTARYEAYGMVLTEALAHGLSVMSTPSGALDGVQNAALWPIQADISADNLALKLRAWLTRSGVADTGPAASGAILFPTWAQQAGALLALLEDRSTG